MEPHDQVGASRPFASRLFLPGGSAGERDEKEILTHLGHQWFGDLKDGVRTGEPGDPRIGVIQVTPAEVSPCPHAFAFIAVYCSRFTDFRFGHFAQIRYVRHIWPLVDGLPFCNCPALKTDLFSSLSSHSIIAPCRSSQSPVFFNLNFVSVHLVGQDSHLARPDRRGHQGGRHRRDGRARSPARHLCCGCTSKFF